MITGPGNYTLKYSSIYVVLRISDVEIRWAFGWNSRNIIFQ